MKTYKLRAETIIDISNLMNELFCTFNEMGEFKVSPFIVKGTRLHDCSLEFESEVSLELIKAVVAKIPDGHVMLETVALKENYTGERVV